MPPPNARRVLISVNPKAGARARTELIGRLQKELQARQLEVTVTSELAELETLSHDPAFAAELRAVVSAGGDGTIALLANLTPPGTPLAILPLGTENLLAKHLRLSTDPARLAATVAAGRTIRLDAGRANGRLFLLMAGIGFDADVVRRLHAGRRGHISHLSYAKPILDSIRNYQYPELRVYCRDASGAERELTARWVFVVNVPRYARNLMISPDAVADDGLLNVCTFKDGSLYRGLMYLGGIWFRRHHYFSDFVTLTATDIRVTADGPVPYQLDGDPGGELPVDITVLPQRLTLLVGEDWK